MNPLKKLASQTAVYGLSTIVGRLLNYLLVPLYTHLFSADEYGVVTELYSYVVFLIVFLTYGMETSFFRFIQNDADKKHVLPSAVISLVSTSLLFVFAVNIFINPISEAAGYQDHPEFIQYFSFIVGIDAFTAILFAKLRSEEKSKLFAVIKLINIGLNIGLNLLFILLFPWLYKQGFELFSGFQTNDQLLPYIFISNLIASAVTLLLLIPQLKLNYSHFSFSVLKEMLRYGFPILISGFAGSINEVLDRLTLRHIITVPAGANNANDSYVLAQIGIYGANYKLSILMTLFIQTFRYGFEPFFFSQAKDKNSPKVYADVMKFFVIFCLLIFLGVMLYIDVVKYFIGPDFHEGLRIVPYLLVANMFLGIYFNLSLWYKLTNQTKYGAYFSIIGAIITIGLLFLLVPSIGYMGAAIATTVCYVSMAVMSYFVGRKHYYVPYDVKTIGLYIIFAGFVYFISEIHGVEALFYKLVINSSLLLFFIAVIVYKEPIFKRIIKR